MKKLSISILLVLAIFLISACSQNIAGNAFLRADMKTAAQCGNCITDKFEQCDDCNDNSFDQCSNDCFLTYCGDLVVQAPNGNGDFEECDDGNSINGDGCSQYCTIENSTCGNNIVEPPEICDDGANGNPSDQCHDDCTFTFCGDGIVQSLNGFGIIESCDDGNLDNSDACNNNCKFTFCGDNIVQQPNGYGNIEFCDGSDLNGETCESLGAAGGTLGCYPNDCAFDLTGCFNSNPTCGNGIVEPPEECDDGNLDNFDSCSNNCMYNILAICGNGMVENQEGCDDGNTDSGINVIQSEKAKFETPFDRLDIGELLGYTRPYFTSNDLSFLEGGVVSTSLGTTDYTQRLIFGEPLESLVSARVINTENEFDTVKDFLSSGSGDFLFLFNMSFLDGLKSTVDGNRYLSNLEEKTINILGTDYEIINAGTSASFFDLYITMYSDGEKDTMGLLDTNFYTVDGVGYSVTLISVGQNPRTATFNVNGEVTQSIQENDYDILSNGLHVGVYDIVGDSVKFYLTKNLMTLYDQNVNDGFFHNAGLEVNSETIEDVLVRINANFYPFGDGNGNGIADPGDNVTIWSINTKLKVDAHVGADMYIPRGGYLSDNLDEPQGMLSDKWDIYYEGLDAVQRNNVFLKPQNDNKYLFAFTNEEGLFYNYLPLLVRDSNTIRFGDYDSNTFIFEPCSVLQGPNDPECYFINESDKFFTSSYSNGYENYVTHVLEFVSVDPVQKVVTFNDLATGLKTVLYTGDPNVLGSASGVLTVGGKDHDFFIRFDGSSYKICMDLDDSGSCSDYGKSLAGVKGGGFFDFDWWNVRNGDTDIRFVTPPEKFENNGWNETGDNESIAISVQLRPSNKLGLFIQSGPQLDMQSDPMDSDLDIGLTFYGVYFELTDPINIAETLIIRYPETQVFANAYVVRNPVDIVFQEDGCDSGCNVMPGWICTGEPSSCRKRGFVGGSPLYAKQNINQR